MTHAIFKHQQLSKLKRFKHFVFVGSNSVNFSLNTAKQLHLNPDSSFLHQVQIGSSIAIKEISTSKDITRQLSNLGLESGKIVRVLSKTSNDSVVIALKDSSIGIGTEIARQIVVTATEETL